MDLFEHRYYRLNKMLMKLYGQWPHQTTRVRFAILIVLCFIGVTYAVPQIMGIAKNFDDEDLFMEGAAVLLFAAFCITKLLAALFNSQKILKLLNHIRKDWEIWGPGHDVDILHKYAQKGRQMTIVYAIMSYTTCTLFVIQPIIPKIIDVILKNGTEPGHFPTPVYYYYIDMQKYYFYLIMHCYLCTSLAFIGSLTFDCTFMVFVQHGCGLFAALGFAELMEAAFSWCFFVIVGINMLLISMTGFQIVKKTANRHETVRFIVCNLLSILHLYVDNYMAQILMDHSISIRSYILNGKWYQLPLKTQKLLLLMIMRCNVPSGLTAGKISILCVQNFSVFLKTSLSYFTVLRSM